MATQTKIKLRATVAVLLVQVCSLLLKMVMWRRGAARNGPLDHLLRSPFHGARNHDVYHAAARTRKRRSHAACNQRIVPVRSARSGRREGGHCLTDVTPQSALWAPGVCRVCTRGLCRWCGAVGRSRQRERSATWVPPPPTAV